MKATVIYNHNARLTHTIPVEELVSALRSAGYEPVHTPTESENDLDAALSDADGGLVLTAGGDGTIRAVATRLLGRDAFLTFLPLGTANNIARTFGIEGEPLQLVQGLENPEKCRFDVGRAKTPWGEHYFLEALGFGFYAEALSAYGPDKPKSVLRAVRAFAQTIPDYRAKPYRMNLDGEEISGDYMLVEVLNTTAFGPRLRVAPTADAGDGLLELIRISESERESFLDYMMGLVNEELHDLPSVEVSRGQRLVIKWAGFPLHIDGEVHPAPRERPSALKRPEHPDEAEIVVELMHEALELLLPSAAAKEAT